MGLVHQVVSHLIETDQKPWLRIRALGVIPFEECWTVFGDLPPDPDPVSVLLKTTTAMKRKDAASLGSLAYASAQGDQSVLMGTGDDRHIRAVAAAIARPADYWAWVHKDCHGERERAVIAAAETGYRLAPFPFDKPFALGAAYLAATEGVPETVECTKPPMPCPLWVAIDKHTERGKTALAAVARKAGVAYERVPVLCFCFEGNLTNEAAPSRWCDRERSWRMRGLGLSVDEARKQWERIRPLVVQELEPMVTELDEHLKLSTKVQLLLF